VPINQQLIIDQIDDILDQNARLKVESKHKDLSDLPADRLSEVVNSFLAALQRFAPHGSSYHASAIKYVADHGIHLNRLVGPIAGILQALRNDYAAGYLRSVVELIHADVFADFIEMAEHLLDQGYKEPAAVILGSVLEEHLRKLCQKNAIDTIVPSDGRAKKADTMNGDLASASVYSKLDQKSVTAWLGLRNSAAHGKYSDYTKDQVGHMLQGVRDFASRNSA
jgi:molybdopterin-guanine dinucleotide biosynthesis protein A